MVYFASTQARAKGLVPSTSHEGGQTETAVAKPPNTSPPPIANGMDRLYH
jgi:hypothetical protein